MVRVNAIIATNTTYTKRCICDMIEGNKSLVENLNFYFLTLLSHNFNMLHVDANPITRGYMVTEL